MTVTDLQRKAVIAYARRQLGHPYVWAGTGPGYDCSGLTMMAWKQVGITLPHNSVEQAHATRFLPPTRENRLALLPGDLVFYYGSYKHPESISHVALFSKTVAKWRHYVIAAVNEQYGVKEHWVNWALAPSAYGFVGH